MNTQKAITTYQKHLGKVDESLGFNLQAKKVKSGVVVTKWYKRSSWSREEKEDQVLITKNAIYRGGNKIVPLVDKNQQQMDFIFPNWRNMVIEEVEVESPVDMFIRKAWIGERELSLDDLDLMESLIPDKMSDLAAEWVEENR